MYVLGVKNFALKLMACRDWPVNTRGYKKGMKAQKDYFLVQEHGGVMDWNVDYCICYSISIYIIINQQLL